MTADLTVDGYTFDNPPDEFSKEIQLDNEPVPHYNRTASDFFQSDSQQVTVTVKGDLSLNEASDLSELETLQQKAIDGGKVTVDFDPFLSGTGVLTDTPFRQESQRGRYNMTIAINELKTDPSGFPAHAEPTTGNVFEYGSFTFGFDPDTVRQEYTRQTAEADRLTGLNRTTDNAGLIPRVEVSGRIDGAGAHALWTKARNNELSYLSAEFQNGWALLSKVLVANDPNTPDFVTGLYRYTAEFVIVKDPSSGIGDVTAVIDKEVKDSGTYVGDPDTGDGQADSVTWTVDSGSAPIGGQTANWSETSVSVRLGGATNYVYAADPDGDGAAEVRINQSAVPSDTAGLYIIATDDDGITNIDDIRDTNTSGGGGTVGAIGYEITGGSGALQDDFIQWDTVTVDVDLNATNYVYVVDPDGDGQGTVTVNQSAVPSDALPLWEVTTDGDSVTNEVDLRDTLIGDPPPDGSDVAFSTSLQVDDGPGLSFNIGPDFADSVADPLLSQAYQQQAFLSEPVTDPSDSVLTALGLSQLVQNVQLSDGGTADRSAGTITQTVSWDTKSDWDNFTESYGIAHEDRADLSAAADQLQISYPSHDESGQGALEAYHTLTRGGDTSTVFEDKTGNGLDVDPKNGNPGGGATGLNGQPSFRSSDPGAVQVSTGMPSAMSDSYTLHVRFYWHNNLDNSFNRIINMDNSTRGSDNDAMFLIDDDDDKMGPFVTHKGDSYDVTRSHPNLGVWYTGTTVYTGSELRGYFNINKIGSQPVSTDIAVNDLKMTYNARSDTQIDFGDYSVQHGRFYSRALSDTEVQRLHNIATQGDYISGTKTFKESVTPDISDVVYSLNGGGIDLTITGSPGQVSEESKTVTLSGSNSVSLNWNTDHRDFRISVSMSKGGLTDSSPVLSKVVLSGSISSGDNDQNPQTDWSLSPGLYDRAANEYEGGGITLRHGD